MLCEIYGHPGYWIAEDLDNANDAGGDEAGAVDDVVGDVDGDGGGGVGIDISGQGGPVLVQGRRQVNHGDMIVVPEDMMLNPEFRSVDWWRGLTNAIIARHIEVGNPLSQQTIDVMNTAQWWRPVSSLREWINIEFELTITRLVREGNAGTDAMGMEEEDRFADFLAEEYGHPRYFVEE